jgi:uncharacterized membrane protein
VGTIDPVVWNLATALGCGLLIGAERERRKGQGAARDPAGIRTFAIASLGGALATLAGGPWLLVAAVLAVGALATVAYWRSHQDDPGLTTEIALVVTVMLGGLAVHEQLIAAGLAVAVAVLLALKGPLHRFVGQVLTEAEVETPWCSLQPRSYCSRCCPTAPWVHLIR